MAGSESGDRGDGFFAGFVANHSQLEGNFSARLNETWGPPALRSVGRYLKSHNATVSAIYTSNVEQYLFQQDDAWKRYYANVATLPIDGRTTFIRSVSNRGYQPQGPGFGFRAQTRLCSVADLLRAFNRGQITAYYDVIAMSK